MTETEAHPITVEVVRNAIVAYADEMANALCKSAYNMMIYEVRDYCCGLIDTQGRMIAQNRGGLPIFLADLGVAVEDGIARYGLDGFAPGDVVVMNHGHVCGQHLNNVVVYAPCFHDGEIVGFAASRAHWVDIGGMRVGFGSSATTEIYAEGLQMRSLKIYEAGKRNETLWQIIEDNVRFPQACSRRSPGADRRLPIGRAPLRRAAVALRAQHGRSLHRAGSGTRPTAPCAPSSRSIPDGSYSAETLLDNDGRNLDRPLRIKVTVRVAGSQLTVDYSQMNPQTAGPMNSGRSGGIAAARVAFKCLTSADLDVNEGCFRALDVVLPEGTMVSARPPAALGLWSIALPTVIDTILKALAPALPERHSGGAQGRHGRLLVLRHASRRQPLPADEYFRRRLGRASARGRRIGERFRLPGRRAQHAGRIAGDPLSFPRRGTCLARRQRRRRTFPRRARRGADLQVPAGLQGQHQFRTHPQSALGPRTAATTAPSTTRSSGPPTAVPNASSSRRPTSRSQAGDRVTFLTAGGGGFGDPSERAPEAIAEDVAQGFVSPKAAEEIYEFRAGAPRR